jgi:hypothetical protein
MRFRSQYIFVLLFVILISPLNLPAADTNLDFSNSVIFTTPKVSKLEQKAIKVLQEEIKKRTGIQLDTKTRRPKKKEPVIAIGQGEQMKSFAGSHSIFLEDSQIPNKEGYRLVIRKNLILIAGKDSRGVFYGVGKLLRSLHTKSGSIMAYQKLDITTSPRYPIRGHQLGYRPKTNAYDAWSPAQFDQYIRELGIFGANCIEIIPPRSDDTLTSPHMKLVPIEMMVKQAEIIDSYGMDVWIWYPNVGEDYSHPDAVRKELEEREDIFKKLKRIDVVFVPGGDPGDLHPDDLFEWLKKVARILNKYHPKAKIWVSPQAFRPTKEWLDAFYNNVNQRFPWFGGVVFGPWVKTTLPDIRKIVSIEIPIRRYPDITHSISCQYPVKDWDLAFAMTLGRECYNPRPIAEKTIHNVLDEFANGSISYSEGINDDVNKFIWSDQDWNPETPVVETLREYSRLFIHPDFSEQITQGILAQEKNWQGSLVANKSVEVTLKQWKNMEKKAPPDVVKNYRFQMGLLRAYYDAYIRERLIHETALESQAREALRNATTINIKEKMEQAESILNQKWENPVAQDYKERCWEIADYLFDKIGSQTSVEKHKAKPGRGDFMDYIDTPLNNAVWLLSQFERIRHINNPHEQLASIEELLNRNNPGPGGFYDNLGKSIETPRLADYPLWKEDPGSLKSPRVSFGAGLKGRQWIHTIQARGFDGRAIPLEWMNQITTLYETPLNIIYENLNPHSKYILKVAYTGRFQSKIQLIADNKFQIHEIIKTGKTPVNIFTIPKEATSDGKLKLTWTCAEGERGAQVAEVWLIPQRK